MSRKAIILAGWIWCLAMAHAEDSVASGSVQYVEVSPEIVTNIGSKGRLRYLRVRVTLRVSKPGSAEIVAYHLPYVRDRLIRILATQEPERALDPEAKQALRATALAELNTFFADRDGAKVDDLLFTDYLIQ